MLIKKGNFWMVVIEIKIKFFLNIVWLIIWVFLNVFIMKCSYIIYRENMIIFYLILGIFFFIDFVVWLVVVWFRW